MSDIKVNFKRDKNNKLVINSIKYTDALFDKIEKHCVDIYNKCSGYKEFKEQTLDYTLDNPLKTTGFMEHTQNLMDKVISGISFSKPAQKKLVELTVQNTVGDLVLDVGDDLKEHIKTVTEDAYKNNIAPQEYWKNLKAPPLVKGEDGAKRSVSARERCKMIARTETSRTQNIANFVINKERGATHWYALGFEDDKTCSRCLSVYGTISDPVYYEIDDTTYFPPLHPNCRHTALFTIKDMVPDFEETNKKYESMVVDGEGPINISAGALNEFTREVYLDSTDIELSDSLFLKQKSNGKYYLNGLEVTSYMEGDGFFLINIPEDKIYEHNKKYGITNNFWSFEVDLMYSKYLKRVEEPDGTVYAVDKDGRKWLIDNDFKQEHYQNELQNEIDFDDIRGGVCVFGGGGYGVINDLLFKEKYLGKDCEPLMKRITPILDEIRKEAYYDSEEWSNPRLTVLRKDVEKILDEYNDDNLSTVVEKIIEIDVAQARAPSLKENITVVRYGYFNEDWLDMTKTHTLVGYQSTSRSEHGCVGFWGQGWNIRILIPTGHKGVSLTSYAFEGYEGEREWLTPRKQEFKTIDYDSATRTVTIELVNNIEGLDLPSRD